GILGQHQQRLLIERSEHMQIGRLRRRRDPGFVFAQQIPNRANHLWLKRLEIEVDDDQRPLRAIVLLQSLFNKRADVFEKMIAQRWLGPGSLRSVRYNWAAVRPRNILLDRYRKSRADRTINSIRPAALIRITVVRIEHRPLELGVRAS